MNKNKYYKTTSIALASAIQLASQSKLSKIEKQENSSRVMFLFPITDDIEKVVNDFWDKKLSQDCFTYFETLRYIKSRLYER